jgi:hypothetical protein
LATAAVHAVIGRTAPSRRRRLCPSTRAIGARSARGSGRHSRLTGPPRRTLRGRRAHQIFGHALEHAGWLRRAIRDRYRRGTARRASRGRGGRVAAGRGSRAIRAGGGATGHLLFAGKAVTTVARGLAR